MLLKIFHTVLFIISGFASSAQQLNASQAVKTLSYVCNGDLNANQNWGGTGVAGMYIFNSNNTANSPGPVSTSPNWMHVIEMQHDNVNAWAGQMGMDYFNDGGLYWRQQSEYTWRSWRQIASEEWVTQQLASGNFLPLSGGTVTGSMGVGILNPTARLHVSGTIRIADPNSPDNGSEIRQNGAGLEIRAGAASGGGCL